MNWNFFFWLFLIIVDWFLLDYYPSFYQYAFFASFDTLPYLFKSFISNIYCFASTLRSIPYWNKHNSSKLFFTLFSFIWSLIIQLHTYRAITCSLYPMSTPVLHPKWCIPIILCFLACLSLYVGLSTHYSMFFCFAPFWAPKPDLISHLFDFLMHFGLLTTRKFVSKSSEQTWHGVVYSESLV
jgi:hypothetical protein